MSGFYLIRLFNFRFFLIFFFLLIWPYASVLLNPASLAYASVQFVGVADRLCVCLVLFFIFFVKCN